MHEPTAKLSGRRWVTRLAVVALVVIMLAGIVTIRASQWPVVTLEQLDLAVLAWTDHQPADYDISVKVEGGQPGVYDVSVRNHLATTATLNGRPLTRRRTFDTWAVKGMFATVRADLEANQEHGYLLLRGTFDPKWGYPQQYERIEVKTGAQPPLRWTVTRFEIPAVEGDRVVRLRRPNNLARSDRR